MTSLNQPTQSCKLTFTLFLAIIAHLTVFPWRWTYSLLYPAKDQSPLQLSLHLESVEQRLSPEVPDKLLLMRQCSNFIGQQSAVMTRLLATLVYFQCFFVCWRITMFSRSDSQRDGDGSSREAR